MGNKLLESGQGEGLRVVGGIFIPRNLKTNLHPNGCPLGTGDFKN